MNNTKSKNSEILRKKLSDFIDSGGGLLEIMELKQFLDNLPYGGVTVKEIEEISGEFEGVNSTIDFLLLDYLVDQILFYESKSN